jgi:hypothetical protein
VHSTTTTTTTTTTTYEQLVHGVCLSQDARPGATESEQSLAMWQAWRLRLLELAPEGKFYKDLAEHAAALQMRFPPLNLQHRFTASRAACQDSPNKRRHRGDNEDDKDDDGDEIEIDDVSTVSMLRGAQHRNVCRKIGREFDAMVSGIAAEAREVEMNSMVDDNEADSEGEALAE